jgi:urease accessory protein UreE
MLIQFQGYFPGGDHRARHGHLHPEAASRQPRRMSRQSDWDIALELAREQSLMDVDDLGAEQYRLRVLNERGACR